MINNCVRCVVSPRTRPDLLCDTCGREADYEKMDKARWAIKHVLEQVRDNPQVGYYLGYGSQSFALLTEAASALWNEPLENVEKLFMPRNPKAPKEAA